MRKEVKFNTIYIIESLKDGDKKTGTNLYNDFLRWQPEIHKNLSAELLEVESRSEFHTAMTRIFEQIFTGRIPYIHFECHGDTDGLELKNGDAISWEELCGLMTRINIPVRNNLFVSVAACFGAYAFEAIGPAFERAPFCATLGPVEKTSGTIIERIFNVYFDTLFRTFNLDEAINALRAAEGPQPCFVVFTSDQFANIQEQRMVDMLNDPEDLRRRANMIAVRLKSSNRSDEPLEALHKEAVKTLRANQAIWVAEWRQKFLIQDDPAPEPGYPAINLL